MSDDLFDFPKLYDETLADDGEWFKVIDENDKLWGDFKCRLIDPTVPHYKIALERLQRKFRKNNPSKVTKKLEEDAIYIELFLELSLVTWRDVPGKGGKPVPFSRENAEKMFASRYGPFIFRGLQSKVEDRANFQSDQESELDEPLGN
jgi:hypothetical protein